MTLKNLIAGVTILAKYDPKGSLCAEHDQIFFMPPSPEAEGVTETDKAMLESLRFHYSDSEGWYCFT